MDRRKKMIGRPKRTDREPRKTNVGQIRRIIITSPNLVKALNRFNIPILDHEEIFSGDEDLQEEIMEGEDELLTDEEIGEEDEDIDYDEPETADPFDIEERDQVGPARYVVQVIFKENTPALRFIETPGFLLGKKNQLVKEALVERYCIVNEIAQFIVEKQKGYFHNPGSDIKSKLVGLNQVDLVKHLQAKGRKWFFSDPLHLLDQKGTLGKEHISNLISTLFFKIRGMGEIPATFFFERRGSKVALSKKEMFDLAKHFYASGDSYTSTTQEAKAFRDYIRDRKGIMIPISGKGREEDRYRRLRDLLREAKKTT